MTADQEEEREEKQGENREENRGVDPDLPRLRRLLGGPELTRLRDRLRHRLASGRALTGKLTLADATPAERAAVAALLGRPPTTARSLTITLPDLDRVLRTSGAAPEGLEWAISELTGPVPVRAEEARNLALAWQQAFTPLRELTTTRPDLAAWHTHFQETGLARRLLRTPEEAAPVLATLAGLLTHLPLSPPQALSTFAAQRTGNAHALDDGPLATLTLDAIRALTGAPPGSGAQWRRDTWAAAGLLLDELSSQVLTLALPGDPHTPTGRALTALASAGEPAILTLRQLLRDPPRFSTGGTVYVCENPTVTLAAADLLPPSGCAPLVCLQGQPSVAALRLLELMSSSGWTITYHGDFDWGGARIATRLSSAVPWTPWRYRHTDYEQALATHPHTTPLTGAPTPTPWDPPLATVLTAHGRRIEEELVLPALLTDLARPTDPP
ncbi:TIGR02679 family protein [Streptomyces xiamenensis]